VRLTGSWSGLRCCDWFDHQAEWLRMHDVIDRLLSDVDDLSEAIERFRGLTQP